MVIQWQVLRMLLDGVRFLYANLQKYAGNSNMGFRFHRCVKLFPWPRLNFGKRGISASIGVRGAHVTYGPTGTRTTVGLPGSGLSFTHLEKPHHAAPVPTSLEPPTNPGVQQGCAGGGIMWIGLIVVASERRAGHYFRNRKRHTSRSKAGGELTHLTWSRRESVCLVWSEVPLG